ncbi:MAG: hypothetical protein WDM91_02985 [Rhizomicrobium sp.]
MTMTDSELDALLAAPLPERDAGSFSVVLMERIAHDQARPARILAWITVGILFALVGLACVFAPLAARSASIALPAALTLLTLLLSFAVLQAARE